MSVDSTSLPFGTLSIEISWLSTELLTLSEVLSTKFIECELSSTLTEGTVSSCLDVPSLSNKGEALEIIHPQIPKTLLFLPENHYCSLWMAV